VSPVQASILEAKPTEYNPLKLIGADRLPTLSANASLGGSGSPTPLDGTWSVGVSLNWNLFDGYLRRYQDGEARATARSSVRWLCAKHTE